MSLKVLSWLTSIHWPLRSSSLSILQGDTFLRNPWPTLWQAISSRGKYPISRTLSLKTRISGCRSTACPAWDLKPTDFITKMELCCRRHLVNGHRYPMVFLFYLLLLLFVVTVIMDWTNADLKINVIVILTNNRDLGRFDRFISFRHLQSLWKGVNFCYEISWDMEP